MIRDHLHRVEGILNKDNLFLYKVHYLIYRIYDQKVNALALCTGDIEFNPELGNSLNYSEIEKFFREYSMPIASF